LFLGSKNFFSREKLSKRWDYRNLRKTGQDQARKI
jgi:hypothetical protein